MKESFAVIQLGGTQHIVKVDDTIQVNRLEGKEGDTLKINEVLLFCDDKETFIGRPYVPYIVEAKIEKQGKADKIDIVKYRAKSRYRKKIGHRQPISVVKITKISKKPAK